MTTLSRFTSLPAIAGGTPVRDTFLLYGRPQIEQPEIDEVVETMRSGWIGAGPRTVRFAEEFGRYTGARHALAVSSCTAALHLALVALGIKPGDEVITTSLTFCATVNVILHCGATPVLVDCDPRTMNIDVEQIRRHITPRTRAIIVVHFAGRPCAMRPILELASAHGLRVVEDCAHAIETLYEGRHAGTLGDVGAFSFYATKNLCTGEGGMVLTDDEEAAERVRCYAMSGMSRDAWKRYGAHGFRHYAVEAPGFKYNMTDLQAAFGIHQLARVEANWKRRQHLWGVYDDALRDLPCFTPLEAEPGTRHAFHMYNLLLDLDRLTVSRDEVLDAMTSENVGVGVHYVPVHQQPFYQSAFQYRDEDFPGATWVGARTLSLPLSTSMTDGDQASVIAAISRVLQYYAR